MLPEQATSIACTFELARRLLSCSKDHEEELTAPHMIVSRLRPKLHGQQKEHVIALYLNTKNKVIKEETISIGTLNISVLHPREIFNN
jgi:DNA repair protein RadC